MRDLKVSFSIKANVAKREDGLLIVDGWNEDMNDVKLIMTEKQFEEANEVYVAEQEEDGGSGYCYFEGCEQEAENVINCVNSSEMYADMCYEDDINDEDYDG